MFDKKSLITEGLIIATVPVIGYLYAYLFYAGNFKVFKIPIDLISITPTTIFVVAGIIMGLFFTILQLSSFVLMFFPARNHDNPILQSVSKFSVFMILLIALLIIYGGDWEKYIYYVVGMFFIAFFEFIFPLITQRGKGNYKDKLIVQHEVERKVRLPLIDDIADRLNYLDRSKFELLIYLVFSLFLTYNAGIANAEKQKKFLELEDTNNIVLNISGDRLILSSYNSNKELSDFFQVTTRDNIIGKNLRLKEIGPLKYR